MDLTIPVPQAGKIGAFTTTEGGGKGGKLWGWRWVLEHSIPHELDGVRKFPDDPSRPNWVRTEDPVTMAMKAN